MKDQSLILLQKYVHSFAEINIMEFFTFIPEERGSAAFIMVGDVNIINYLV